jgi:hypothetical protein
MPKNAYGLSRDAPSAVRFEIRRRSKFGCVTCRSAVDDYEHIDPAFPDATRHDPSAMCCLCGSCHHRVSRGHLSKAAVLAAYRGIDASPVEQVPPPHSPLDLYSGHASLTIAGLACTCVSAAIVRYYGEMIVGVRRVAPGGPWGLYATFFGPSGEETLRLKGNSWEGSLDNWDIEVIGPRITVRRALGEIVLRLRALSYPQRPASPHSGSAADRPWLTTLCARNAR